MKRAPCASAHCAIDAVVALRSKHGIRATEVESVCRLDNGDRLVSVLSANRLFSARGLQTAIESYDTEEAGEMADADYGYVGSGPGRITLYRGKEVVRRNIKSDDAVDQLIEIIKEDGNWFEFIEI